MASPLQDEFQKIEKEVLAKLKADDDLDYTALERHPKVLKAAEEAMKTTYDELKKMTEHADSLENALAHLSPERQQLIRTTFRLQSFKVDLRRQSDGTAELLFESLEGTPLSFVPSIVKICAENYEENRILLYARIIFEVAVMVLNLVGIAIAPSQPVAARVIAYITSVLSAHTNIFADLEKVIEAAKRKDLIGVAKGVVACLIDLFTIAGTPIVYILKIFLGYMTWPDMIITVTQVLCYIAASALSAGAAALARVILWLLNASLFLKKLEFMNEFESIRDSL